MPCIKLEHKNRLVVFAVIGFIMPLVVHICTYTWNAFFAHYKALSNLRAAVYL